MTVSPRSEVSKYRKVLDFFAVPIMVCLGQNSWRFSDNNEKNWMLTLSTLGASEKIGMMLKGELSP